MVCLFACWFWCCENCIIFYTQGLCSIDKKNICMSECGMKTTKEIKCGGWAKLDMCFFFFWFSFKYQYFESKSDAVCISLHSRVRNKTIHLIVVSLLLLLLGKKISCVSVCVCDGTKAQKYSFVFFSFVANWWDWASFDCTIRRFNRCRFQIWCFHFISFIECETIVHCAPNTWRKMSLICFSVLFCCCDEFGFAKKYSSSKTFLFSAKILRKINEPKSE